jgi:hypothetical protein
LKRREDRLKVIEQAKARLEERQRQADKAEARYVDEAGVTRGPTNRSVKRAYGVPGPDTRDNFTDPDSRIMPTASGGFEQCYNAQAAVDEGSQLIVAAELINGSAEAAMLLPMVDQVECNTGASPRMVLADTNYASEAGFRELENRPIAAYVALGKENKQRTVRINLPATGHRPPATGHRPHGAMATDTRGSCALSAAQGDTRAGLRLDQAGTGLQVLQPTRHYGGQRGMAADVCRHEPHAHASTGMATRMSIQTLSTQA